MKINVIEWDDMRGETAKWLGVEFFAAAEKPENFFDIDNIEVTANGKLVDVAMLADAIDIHVAREIKYELDRERRLNVDRIQELVGELSELVDDANRED